jgi:hypothetical protein
LACRMCALPNLTIGRRRRCEASASCARVAFFSALSSSSRACCHSLAETIFGFSTRPLCQADASSTPSGSRLQAPARSGRVADRGARGPATLRSRQQQTTGRGASSGRVPLLPHQERAVVRLLRDSLQGSAHILGGMSGHRQAPRRSGLLRLAVAVVLGAHEVEEGQRRDAQSFHVGHPTGGGSIWEDVSSFWSGTWNSRPNRCRSPWLISKVMGRRGYPLEFFRRVLDTRRARWSSGFV